MNEGVMFAISRSKGVSVKWYTAVDTVQSWRIVVVVAM
jgi:hypothetical protein